MNNEVGGSRLPSSSRVAIMSDTVPGKDSIEDIILNHDCRGISALRPFLPSSFCEDAARFILKKNGSRNKTALITTGFFILSAEAPETDGPPGTIALARALRQLGFEVIYVSDRYGIPLLTLDGGGTKQVIEFPISDHAVSRDFARGLLADVKPDILIAVERCGFTAGNRHLNMAGKDISDFTAKIDYLFLSQENTLGIGDGGNEIGMGRFTRQIKSLADLPGDPAVTPTRKTIISSVSNWGAYGLITALSRLSWRDLLPSVEWAHELLTELVARGAVDGISGETECTVDAFSAEQNAGVLLQLKQLLQSDTISTAA